MDTPGKPVTAVQQSIAAGSLISLKVPPSNSGKTKRRCPYCPFSSYYSASLTVHLRRHTGEKPYQCIFCNKVFGDRSNMNSHVRRYHREARRGPNSSAGVSRHSLLSARSATLPIKESRLPSSYKPLVEMPVIASVYSKDTQLNTTGIEIMNPISFASELGSISADSLPTMVSTTTSGLASGFTRKLNRRKPTVVRKQVPALDFLPGENSSFSTREEAMFGSQNPGFQSDEENPHAVHTDESSNNDLCYFPLPKEEQQDSDVLLSLGSSSDDRISDEETQSKTQAHTDMQNLYTCKHCDIFFKSCILHTLHVGCHGYDDPFKCNVCGVECKDAVEFHCHFARGNHNGSL